MADKKRCVFYIDGFNFYYGLKRAMLADRRWGNAYWIDLVKLCEGFAAPDEFVEKVIYFTAYPLSARKSSRQSAFLNANKAINGDKFEVVRGKYLDKHIICPYCKGDISRPEEKKTDVNISVRILRDCIHKSVDTVVLVSADTDLLPPLETVKSDFPQVKIRICFPPSNYSHEISETAKSWKVKVTQLLKNYKRFENAVMSDDVGEYKIPSEWKSKQTWRGDS